MLYSKKNMDHTEIIYSQYIIVLAEMNQSKTPLTAFGFRALGGPGVLGGGFAPTLYPTLNCCVLLAPGSIIVHPAK